MTPKPHSCAAGFKSKKRLVQVQNHSPLSTLATKRDPESRISIFATIPCVGCSKLVFNYKVATATKMREPSSACYCLAEDTGIFGVYVRATKQRWMDTWTNCSLRPAPQNREALRGQCKPTLRSAISHSRSRRRRHSAEPLRRA